VRFIVLFYEVEGGDMKDKFYLKSQTGRLTKLSQNENELRSKIVIGEFLNAPIVGESFMLISEPLDETTGTHRMVKTSIVEAIDVVENSIIFNTMNSTYRLDIFES
jgi:hypothetical protein